MCLYLRRRFAGHFPPFSRIFTRWHRLPRHERARMRMSTMGPMRHVSMIFYVLATYLWRQKVRRGVLAARRLLLTRGHLPGQQPWRPAYRRPAELLPSLCAGFNTDDMHTTRKAGRARHRSLGHAAVRRGMIPKWRFPLTHASLRFRVRGCADSAPRLFYVLSTPSYRFLCTGYPQLGAEGPPCARQTSLKC